jgi:hypothetical protein
VDWTGDRRVIAAVLLVIVAVVLAAVVQPLVMGAVTSLLDWGSEATGTPASDTPTGTAVTANTDRTNSAEAATAGNPGATSRTTTTSLRTSMSPTPTSTTQTPTPPAVTPPPTPPAVTPPPTQPPIPTPAVTPRRTNSGTATAGDGTDTGIRSATSDERSPRIEAFTITDRSDGAATLDVAWNVTDPNSNLAAVRVMLVADPAGEARTIERRRFDASEAQSTGTTTFVVPEGMGSVYELRIAVTDTAGNTAFLLAREVADGSPDG